MSHLIDLIYCFVLCILMLKKEDDTEPYEEFNLDHFICMLQLVENKEFIFVKTETVSILLMVQKVLKKGCASITYPKDYSKGTILCSRNVELQSAN